MLRLKDPARDWPFLVALLAIAGSILLLALAAYSEQPSLRPIGITVTVHEINALPSGTEADHLAHCHRYSFVERQPVLAVIGHMKAEHRMDRNYLKGREGDRSNAVLAAAGYNFSLLLRWL